MAETVEKTWKKISNYASRALSILVYLDSLVEKVRTAPHPRQMDEIPMLES